ncbi:MAG: tRNA delta(2)-isopentenylpyrophosphate transferase [Gammaproteobacteria bacterium]|jgi:tRNA dimethylallyltransferase|nr:tRNA delta(2)-isopentenylpyrophosphate transferase [Gammaproteobacteria bacterium]
MIDRKKIVIYLMGPTASGKTKLAVELVQHFPFEIISVDSAMVYRGMNIGTAKPSADILALAPHRLINIREPNDTYSAAQFRIDALREIADIHAQGKIPLLVGGTMLYFRALQQGIAAMPSADPSIRLMLSEEADKIGWALLHNRLAEIDPDAANRIHPNDSQRIQRALEVHLLTGKNLSAWHASQSHSETNYLIYPLIIAPHDRAILHARIETRFVNILKQGLVDEVKTLLAHYHLDSSTSAMRSVGYRQVLEYLENKCTYDEMQERSIIATRQLAKRQLTWLRHWANTTWFDSEAPDLLTQVASYLRDRNFF